MSDAYPWREPPACIGKHLVWAGTVLTLGCVSAFTAVCIFRPEVDKATFVSALLCLLGPVTGTTGVLVHRLSSSSAKRSDGP